MSELVLFTGPSLPPAEAEARISARVLPPVSQGDLYSVARDRPTVIGIVDGYFDVMPAVWHKEILWALSQGVHVVGAASLGALRAAELAVFGMEGVGEVFEAFHDGRLEDDDEVTIVHGPPEAGYVALSEAMVNIRATLAAACREELIDETVRDRLVAIAKETHYRERTWEGLWARARETDVPLEAVEAVREWLPDGRVDQKRRDAEALCARMEELAGGEPHRPSFRFQYTQPWEELRTSVDRRVLEHVSGAAAGQHDASLDELRLDGPTYRRAEERALIRILSSELAERLGLTAPSPSSGSATERLVRQGLRPGRARELAEEDALVARMRDALTPYLPAALRDELRLQGIHDDLAARASDKQHTLAARGLQNPSLADAGLDERGLWHWFFVERQNAEVPGDLRAYARELGFEGLEAFRRAALRERVYLRCRDTRTTRRSV